MTILLALGTLVGIVLALLNIRDKLWPNTPTPHPLTECVNMLAATNNNRLEEINTSLREIAAAIYETKDQP